MKLDNIEETDIDNIMEANRKKINSELPNYEQVAKIELVKEGKVRRSKLYYLRGTSGKKAKVKGRVVARKKQEGNSNKPDLAEEKVEEIKDETVQAEVTMEATQANANTITEDAKSESAKPETSST